MEKNIKKNIYVYRITLPYSKNQHNIVNQLLLIKKKRKDKEIYQPLWMRAGGSWLDHGGDGRCGRKQRESIQVVLIEPLHGLRCHLLRLERIEIKKSVHEPKCCEKFCDVCRANTEDINQTCMDKQIQINTDIDKQIYSIIQDKIFKI